MYVQTYVKVHVVNNYRETFYNVSYITRQSISRVHKYRNELMWEYLCRVRGEETNQKRPLFQGRGKGREPPHSFFFCLRQGQVTCFLGYERTAGTEFFTCVRTSW